MVNFDDLVIGKEYRTNIPEDKQVHLPNGDSLRLDDLPHNGVVVCVGKVIATLFGMKFNCLVANKALTYFRNDFYVIPVQWCEEIGHVEKQCVCELSDLMIRGCRCGCI